MYLLCLALRVCFWEWEREEAVGITPALAPPPCSWFPQVLLSTVARGMGFKRKSEFPISTQCSPGPSHFMKAVYSGELTKPCRIPPQIWFSHWFPCCPLNRPSTLLPQGLWSGWSFCWNAFSQTLAWLLPSQLLIFFQVSRSEWAL
jgi:hypothetical protein